MKLGELLSKWWAGTADGEHYIVTNDKDKLPFDAKPIPLQTPPTHKTLDVFRRYGLKVKVKTTRDN